MHHLNLFYRVSNRIGECDQDDLEALGGMHNIWDLE